MAEQTLSINIDTSKWDKDSRELKQKLSNLSPLTAAIGQLMRASTLATFAAEGAHDGQAHWLPLSVATLMGSFKGSMYTKRGRVKKGVERKLQNRQILTKSGQLRKSIQVNSDRSKVLVGSNKAYACIHQEGGMAGKDQQVYIPQRAFLYFGPGLKLNIEQAVKDYLRE